MGDHSVRETVHRVIAHVDGLDDGFGLDLPVGGMRLIDYLPSRISELTIHTLDVASALELVVNPPAGPMEITLHLLADRAVLLGQGPTLALAITGRRTLPDRFNILG